MTDTRTRGLTRQQIAAFMPDPRGVLAFEAVQEDVQSQFAQIATCSFVTLGPEPVLSSERILALSNGELIGTDGGANGLFTVSLAPTGITPAIYGDGSHIPIIQVDAKGRVIGISTSPLGGGQGLSVSVRTVTASATVNDTDAVVLANAAGGAVTVTLPPANANTGRTITVKKIDVSANAVSVSSTDTIDGAGSISLPAQWDRKSILSNGTAWFIVA